MNLYIPTMQSFSSHLPPIRGSRHEVCLTFGNNIPRRVSLLGYHKSARNYKIWASFEGATKPLIDPGKLPSSGAVRFSSERSNLGRVLLATFCFCHEPYVTFYNDITKKKVGLALLRQQHPKVFENSGNLRIKELEAGEHLRVYHSGIVNYLKTAQNSAILASINVNRRSLELLIDLGWLHRCDELCFSFEHTSKGRVFRATYYFSDSSKVKFVEKPVKDF